MNAVPVIDFGELNRSGEDGTAARMVDQACANSGFFLLSNHGLESQLDDVWSATRWFFEQHPDIKQSVARSELNSRGYFNRELTKNTRDMKEVFDFGAVLDPDLPDDHVGNRGQDGWNSWPDASGGTEFQNIMKRYFADCQHVAMTLLRTITSNLGAPEDTLEADFFPRHSSFLRLNYYPVADPHPEPDGPQVASETGHMGVHHHTDAGALTLLLQDQVGGLEIFHQDRWLPVDPLPDALVINIGDIVQVWSNDRYQAPLHRVVASTGQDRYSLPYFFNPQYDASYQPLRQALVGDEPERYQPINWGHFRHHRQHGDYGDYGDEIQISDFLVDQGADSA